MAIKPLAESVSYITAVISQLQDCGIKSGDRFSELKQVYQANRTDYYSDNAIQIDICSSPEMAE
jgi:hypothetical protein